MSSTATLLYRFAVEAQVAFVEAGLPPLLVRECGCTRCQRYHYEGDGWFESHIGFQSKHGWDRVPIAQAILAAWEARNHARHR